VDSGVATPDDRDHVLFDIRDGVATVTLNRPEKLNAITPPMHRAMLGFFKQAEADPSVHVIVLKGNGRAFCSGVDLSDMSREHQNPEVRGVRLDAMEILEAADRWATLWMLQKPIIVKAHGHCVAWGLEIALCADFVVAAEDALFSYPSVADGNGLPDSNMALYHLGPQWAKWMLLTGDFVDGKTAERIGLALKAVPASELDAEVDRLARVLTTVPVDLLAMSKAVLNYGVDLMGRQPLQQFAAQSNSISRMTSIQTEFIRIVREEGTNAAIKWRDARRREALQ
jgi:enoyl-CoA hydratase